MLFAFKRYVTRLSMHPLRSFSADSTASASISFNAIEFSFTLESPANRKQRE
jgi:hypothetical protein